MGKKRKGRKRVGLLRVLLLSRTECSDEVSNEFEVFDVDRRGEGRVEIRFISFPLSYHSTRVKLLGPTSKIL